MNTQEIQDNQETQDIQDLPEPETVRVFDEEGTASLATDVGIFGLFPVQQWDLDDEFGYLPEYRARMRMTVDAC